MKTKPKTKRASGKPRYQWDAAKVKALREHLGLTQTEMSAELGVRQQTISEWECGLYQPRGPSVTLLTLVAERVKFKYGEKEEEAS